MADKTVAERLRELADTGWRPIIKVDGVPYYAADLAADALDAKDARIAELEDVWKRVWDEQESSQVAVMQAFIDARDAEIATLQAALTGHDEAVQRWGKMIDERDAEVARLRAALEKRDGWQHDMDCGLASGGYCDCGHTEARAALRK